LNKSTPKVLVILAVFLASTMLPSIPIVRAQENTWTTLAPMPTPRSNFGLAVVNKKIYAIGGSNDTTILATNEMYNPETDTWTTKTSIPTPRSLFAITTCQNKIYAITGSKPSRPYSAGGSYTLANEVYNPETDTWETKAPLNSQYPRYWINAHTINDKIYLISGLTNEFVIWSSNSPEINIYDPLTDTWTKGEQIPHPVHRYGSVAVENKIYVFGGVDYKPPEGLPIGTVYDFTQIYDTTTDTWSLGSPMPVAVRDSFAVVTPKLLGLNQIYVLGGEPYEGPKPNLNQIYNTHTGVWSNGTALPEDFIPSGIVAIDDCLYAISGTQNLSCMSIESETPTPTPTSSPEPEPFPTTIALVSIATVAVIGAGILVYFKKYRK